MATHSNILAWEINPMDRGAGRAAVLGSQRVRHNLATNQQWAHRGFHILPQRPDDTHQLTVWCRFSKMCAEKPAAAIRRPKMPGVQESRHVGLLSRHLSSTTASRCQENQASKNEEPTAQSWQTLLGGRESACLSDQAAQPAHLNEC